jgi:hypothetical protein
VTRDFSGEDVYEELVKVGDFRHVRTTRAHLMLRGEPTESHENADTRIVNIPEAERYRFNRVSDSTVA